MLCRNFGVKNGVNRMPTTGAYMCAILHALVHGMRTVRMHTEMAACTQARWCVLVRSTNGNGYAYGTGLIKCVRVGGVSESVLSVCAYANVVYRIKRILWLCDVCLHVCARFVCLDSENPSRADAFGTE